MKPFNFNPYNDDFTPEKGFYKILGVPGKPLQARELTQIQSITQHQISSFADHIFKNGSMVIPGHISYDLSYSFVKLEDTFNSTAINISSIDPALNPTEDQIVIVGSVSGVRAKVLKVIYSENGEPNTLYVKYLDSGTDGISKTFFIGDITASPSIFAESIRKEGTGVNIAKIQNSNMTPIGQGCSVTIDSGVYYIDSYFIDVFKQTLILDKYSNSPSYRIGLTVLQEIITSNDDSSLLENATGTANYAAPGSDRFKITLVLDKKLLSDTSTDNFIELLRIENGKRLKQVEDTEYSIIEEAIARRTFDKSGNFYIQPFKIDIREHLNDGSNRGVYTLAQGGMESKLAVGLEPSKAYVEGYEIKTISTQFVNVDKGRETLEINNSSLRTALGSWIYVTEPFSIPQTNSYQKIGLYSVEALLTTGQPNGNDPGSNNLIGTANIREFELISNTTNSDYAIYKMYIFNIQMNPGFSIGDARSYYAAGSPPLAGTICSENILIGPAVGELTAGQNVQSKDGTRRETIVSWTPSTGSLITKSKSTYNRLQVNEIIDYASSVGSVLTENSAKLIEKLVLQETTNVAPIYTLRDSSIKTIRNSINQYDVNYTAKRIFTVAVTDNSSPSGAGKIIINLGNNEEFGPFNTKDYVCSVLDGALVGTILDLSFTAGVTVSITTGGSLQISGLPSGTYGNAVRLNAPVLKTTPTPKSKVLISETVTVGYIVNQPIVLNRSDIFKVESIIEGGVTDITDHFWLDNGQRDTYYGRGKIYLKTGAPNPSNNALTITYSYFEHSSGGDFFCVDSYNQVQVPYQNIPIYYSKDTNKTYVLSDCLDFRPKTNDIDDNFPLAGNSEIVQVGGSIILDYQFYVGRIDKIYLDRFGNFNVIKGTPSRRPSAPEDPKSGMLLYVLNIPPYTYAPSQVGIKLVDNRRFTERDIGAIVDRVSNLEYYTTLSLKEQQTSSLEILDASTGLPRYKNGFIVDNFVGHGIGDVYSDKYRCAIDPKFTRMRPEFTQNNVDLILQEVDVDNSNVVISKDFAKTGKLLTLPYTEVVAVNQPFASKTVNINPYNIINFIGKVSLDPSSDTWRDTSRKPDIISEDNTLFDAERQRLISQGVLGTVWGEWTTNWTGTPQSTTQTTSSVNSRTVLRNNLVPVTSFTPGFENVTVNGQMFIITNQFPATVDDVTSVITTTTNTQQGQTRVGTTTQIVPGKVSQSVDDKVIETSIIPYIRTRDVSFTVTRMKPNTILYSYFDNVNVTEFVCSSAGANYSAAPIVTLTGGGGSGAVVTPLIKNGKIVYFNIDNGGSGYTSAPTLSLSFVNGATVPDLTNIVINISSGRITSIYLPIRTDVNGKAEGVFRIPNSDAVNFRTGSRVFRFTDSQTNNNQETTAWAEATYTASGLLETRQNTIISTREPEIVRNSITESRVVTNTVQNSQTVSEDGQIDVNWIDPLAQTFLITDRDGGFLTSIEIFFATKDPNIPVTLQIRNTVNGYPGQQIIPFGEVTLNPTSVRVDPTGTQNISTKFTFESPMYIRANTEYAVVLLSNSDLYNVWVAKIGDVEVGTDTLITNSPYAGVLFKSQNASTWTAEQTEDLKMKINRASFDISKTSDIFFANDSVPTKTLNALSLYTKAGSTLVRVFDRNHGLVKGSVVSRVTISNVTGTTLNGIPVEEINGVKIVDNVTLDSYTISVTTPATATGLVGNSGIIVTNDIQYNVIHPIFQTLILSDTNITSEIFTTSGKSVNGSEIPYRKSSVGTGLILNTDYLFDTPRVIASDYNELNLIQNGIGKFNNKSLIIRNRFTSTRENLSPVIDLDRCSAILIGNRIANYTHQNVNVDNFDLNLKYTLTNNCYILASDSSINTTTDVFTDYSIIGKYINIDGTNITGGNKVNTFSGAVLVTDIVSPRKITVSGKVFTNNGSLGSPTAGDVLISVYDNFVSEISPNSGSSPAIYITKPYTLKNPANSVKIFLTASRSAESDFDVYYRVSKDNETRLFENNIWRKIEYTEVPFNNLDYFREYEYTLDNIDNYSTVSYKIIIRSTNSSKICSFDDFRGLAITS